MIHIVNGNNNAPNPRRMGIGENLATIIAMTDDYFVGDGKPHQDGLGYVFKHEAVLDGGRIIRRDCIGADRMVTWQTPDGIAVRQPCVSAPLWLSTANGRLYLSWSSHEGTIGTRDAAFAGFAFITYDEARREFRWMNITPDRRFQLLDIIAHEVNGYATWLSAAINLFCVTV